MEKYFGGEEISIDEIKKVIRKATIDNTMVPVTCGSSYRNMGVQMLLDAIIDYMPAPTDVPAIKGTNPETGEDTLSLHDALPIQPDVSPNEAVAFLSERYNAEGIEHKIELLDCAEEDWRNNWKKMCIRDRF